MSETFTLARDGEPDLRFTGACIASASSNPFKANASPERWTELKLFRTGKGRYVAWTVGRSKRKGEHDRFSAVVCDTPAEVIQAFGQGWLAKKLYQQANIENIEEIN